MLAIKGYSAEELSRLFIVLKIIAKNQHGKLVIGEIVLAGRNGKCVMLNVLFSLAYSGGSEYFVKSKTSFWR